MNTIQQVYNRTNNLSMAYKEYDFLKSVAKIKATVVWAITQIVLFYIGVNIAWVFSGGVLSWFLTWWYYDAKALRYIKDLKTTSLTTLLFINSDK